MTATKRRTRSPLSTPYYALEVPDLRRLRIEVEHEIVDRVRHREPYRELLDLLGFVERRLQRLEEQDTAPTFARRQQIAAEKAPTLQMR